VCWNHVFERHENPVDGVFISGIFMLQLKVRGFRTSMILMFLQLRGIGVREDQRNYS